MFGGRMKNCRECALYDKCGLWCGSEACLIYLAAYRRALVVAENIRAGNAKESDLNGI